MAWSEWMVQAEGQTITLRQLHPTRESTRVQAYIGGEWIELGERRRFLPPGMEVRKALETKLRDYARRVSMRRFPILPTCSHGGELGCHQTAEVLLVAPDATAAPGGWMCRHHGELIRDEYAEKLGECWTLDALEKIA